MKLSKSSVEEFIEIYKAEYGEIPSYKEAEIMATELLNLYNCLISKK